jgi:two-component system, NarL family, sensor histidine kinase DegS
MKKKIPELSERYLAALRVRLDTQGPNAVAAARGLGREVIASGFDTVDLARMHEQALVALAPSHDFANARNGLIRRAGNFFTAALLPAEQAHRATRNSLRQVQEHAAALRVHRAALAKGNRELKREVLRRKAGESVIKKAKEHYHLLFVQSQSMQKELRQLTRQILSAQEDERREISRELHDEVVQTLVGVNVELAALGKAASLGIKDLRKKIARTQRLVKKSVHAVHQFARELRPALLDDLGLIPALHGYMKIVAARKKLKIHLTAFAGVETLDSARRTVLYRVAQEALTNVARHAGATVVTMNIRRVDGAICMEVHDNGKSFQVRETLSGRTNKRLGLLGMRERVEMVGGALTIESAPGQGTTVRAEIPFSPGDAGGVR